MFNSGFETAYQPVLVEYSANSC